MIFNSRHLGFNTEYHVSVFSLWRYLRGARIILRVCCSFQQQNDVPVTRMKSQSTPDESFAVCYQRTYTAYITRGSLRFWSEDIVHKIQFDQMKNSVASQYYAIRLLCRVR